MDGSEVESQLCDHEQHPRPQVKLASCGGGNPTVAAGRS